MGMDAVRPLGAGRPKGPRTFVFSAVLTLFCRFRRGWFRCRAPLLLNGRIVSLVAGTGRSVASNPTEGEVT
jgi:hypothetical protein